MSANGPSRDLTQAIKELARQSGAALVGIAPIERFDPQPPYYDKAPRGHDPRDFVPNAKSVISYAQPVLNAVMDAPAVLADMDIEMIPPDIKYPYLELLYGTVGHRLQDYMLEQIGQLVGQMVQMEGFETMIFPTTGLHPHQAPTGHGASEEHLSDQQIWQGPNKKWSDKYSPFRYTFGPLSHRHAATRAGLGEFGYNNIVVTREFGPRQRFNTIVTEAELVPDPLISEPICLRDNCRLCMKACIVEAITLRDDRSFSDYRLVDKVDKDVIFIDTPAKTDPVSCNQRRARIPNSPVRGDCARICPLPVTRTHLPVRLKAMVEEWIAERGMRLGEEGDVAKGEFRG
jgi:epoxyqueuosine reductase QueG